MREAMPDKEATLKQAGGIAWLEAPLGRARAVFSTRVGGESPAPRDGLNLALHTEFDPAIAIRNRLAFCDAVGVALDDLVLCRQVHGTDLLTVRPADAGAGGRSQDDRLGRADGLMRAGPEPPLVIQVADCAPVVIADPETGGGAVVHAGWRGAAGGIIGKAVEAVADMSEQGRSGLRAAIGPCVRSPEYEVGEEVYEAFGHWGAEREKVFQRSGQTLSLSLGRVVEIALLSAGIPQQAIIDTAACTMSRQDLFFSYRRDGVDSGRLWGMLI